MSAATRATSCSMRSCGCLSSNCTTTPTCYIPVAGARRRLDNKVACGPPAATRKLAAWLSSPRGSPTADGRNRPHQRPRHPGLPTIPSRERQHPGFHRRQPHQRPRGHDRGLSAPPHGARRPCRPGPAPDRRGGPRRRIAPGGAVSALTEDTLLDGRVRLIQPARGHRAGTDAVLLAAAAPLEAGDRVVDAGAATGAVGLMLARRASIRVVLVERDPGLAELCRRNLALNGCPG